MTKRSHRGKSNQLRIIGGSMRSRILRFPDADGLRPTSDRIRETLFNWLQNDISGSRCLDLFAGSGALGIEALSRGASEVQFVESNQQVAAALQDSLDELAQDAAKLDVTTAEKWIAANQNAGAFDIVFLDPPFDRGLANDICQALVKFSLVQENSLIYLEDSSPSNPGELPEDFAQLRSKQAGQVSYALYQYQGNL
ncbi:MAG: 16S rRNA (guanine(966)-N(2))-methyltransferase RsmD [Pseudomonadales bacterium]|nr:16S rRNA (guanine(966)-N(2))-methyltransferase RsmD [Pseudomonadales bacterium]